MIPKEIQEKIEEKRKSYYAMLPDNLYAMAHDTGFDRGAIFGYQLATDGREEEGQAEWEFLTMIRANYQIHKNSGGEWKGYSAEAAVNETYEDWIEMISHLPMKRGESISQETIDKLNSDGREELEKENERLRNGLLMIKGISEIPNNPTMVLVKKYVNKTLNNL